MREVYHKYPQEFSSIELSFSFLSKSWGVSADVLSFVYMERDPRIADLIFCKSSTTKYPGHTRTVILPFQQILHAFALGCAISLLIALPSGPMPWEWTIFSSLFRWSLVSFISDTMKLRLTRDHIYDGGPIGYTRVKFFFSLNDIIDIHES